MSNFDGIASIRFCGYVSGKEFERVFREAEMLLHVEAFDEDSIDMVKHSVSTKIADSLASGIPLFAYGPAQVASMEHLIKHDCAITALSKDELKTRLMEAFENPALCRKKAENGLSVAGEYHDSSKNSKKLYEIITCSLEKQHESPSSQLRL